MSAIRTVSTSWSWSFWRGRHWPTALDEGPASDRDGAEIRDCYSMFDPTNGGDHNRGIRTEVAELEKLLLDFVRSSDCYDHG